MKIELNVEESNLRKEIEDRMLKVRKAFDESRIGSDVSMLIEEMGKRAHQLHILLKKRGYEPKHHDYMVKNRGLPADDPEFYMHFHPIEDLLKYLDDSHANDDPQDSTIGQTFTFRVYSRRWKHDDTYEIVRTADGWDVKHISIGGPCDKGGRPFFFKNLQQDLIQYPTGLDGWIEWLWGQAASQGLSAQQVQAALQELADWVSETERKAPVGGVWEGY